MLDKYQCLTSDQNDPHPDKSGSAASLTPAVLHRSPVDPGRVAVTHANEGEEQQEQKFVKQHLPRRAPLSLEINDVLNKPLLLLEQSQCQSESAVKERRKQTPPEPDMSCV